MSQQPFITELLNDLKVKYVELIDDAAKFFNEYDALYGVYAKEKARIEEIKLQVSTIQSYKEEHGIYPQIKDHPDAESYLAELDVIKDKALDHLKELEPSVVKGFKERRAKLENISTSIVDNMIKEKDANKFLTTIILKAPLENDHTRCPNNEKTKPLFIAGMAAKFLMQLCELEKVDEPFIMDRMPNWIDSVEHPNQKELEPEMLKEFKASVLQPVVQAALIHNIGSYSMDAHRIYRGNRYRVLDEPTRKSLVRIIYDNTLNYLKYGLGEPESLKGKLKGKNPELEQEKFELLKSLLENFSKAQHPLGNVIRIPMIYSSFMLSTKLKHDYLLLYKAYDILTSGIEKKVIYPDYASVFQAMVGKYPLGSGLFFISKETHVPERAVVIGLNPSQPKAAIVKQLTRRQLQFDDHTQVEVSPEYNIANEVARRKSDYGPDYFKKQFPSGYFWNPAELWEVDIDHNRFWRRDNQLKVN